MGDQQLPGRRLEPGHLDLFHAGLSPLWLESGRLSPHQSAASHGQCRPFVGGTAANDGRPVAERSGGRLVRLASAQCGVGGLGDGAQECSEHTVWNPHPVGLSGIREEALLAALCGSPGISGAGLDGQADAGDLTLCSASVGLLAPEKAGRELERMSGTAASIGGGEAAFVASGGSGRYADDSSG